MPTTINLCYEDPINKEPVGSYQTESLLHRIENHKLFQGRKIESVSNDTIAANSVLLKNYGPFEDINLNGLAEAAHIAYDSHHGLTLSPDHLFISILQGLSIHITQDPEKYRAILGLKNLQSGTKEKIDVRRDNFQLGNPDNDWEGAFPEFLTKISEKLEEEMSPLLLGKFSTSTERDLAVTALTIMDVYKSYFEFSMTTMCGIPEITLQGEKEDWEQLKNRVEGILGRFDDVGFWTDHLYPILDQFIAATGQNKIDEEFWKSLYKIEGGSGGPFLSGWIRSLFPYISVEEFETKSSKFVKNPYIDWKEYAGPFSGIRYNQLPAGFTSTPFVWNYFHQEFDMSFIGGLLGVSINSTNNHVSPVVGWAVLHA
jgi:hypothetical protein